MSDQCQVESICAMRAETGECSCDMPEKLLALADEAWRDLLKEKIKMEITKSCGDSMEKLAQLVAETNKAKWSNAIKRKVRCEEYTRKIKAFFAEGA